MKKKMVIFQLDEEMLMNWGFHHMMPGENRNLLRFRKAPLICSSPIRIRSKNSGFHFHLFSPLVVKFENHSSVTDDMIDI